MMAQVVIENPILNSPFEEPRRHFRFSEDGITNDIVGSRRSSSYFVPIPRPRKRGAQLSFDTEWTQDRVKENEFINQVRERVAIWRRGGHIGITRTTARLLQYWTRPDRERRLFFCQVEAMETAIYLTEVAPRYGDAWLDNKLREANATSDPLLYRIAFKMATGSGKTLVMAMLIAWHTLNKLANPQDARFSDAFLVVTPGITIRDRLRVLLPNDPGNYYRLHDLVPAELLPELGQAKLVVTNFHAFLLRERVAAGRLTKALLGQGDSGSASPFTETPGQMVRRVCRELGNKRNLVVINDEAHHCYRRKPDDGGERLKGDERKEAQRREEEARVWISGLEAVKERLGIRVIYDLSATPFFLRGSGYSEGTLFPWVVSDFSLIDAIECGIVKVPRVPVQDNAMLGPQPTYRDLWLRVRDNLPKKGRRTEALGGEPSLPAELEGALQSLYSNYEKYYHLWEQNTAARERGLTAPVFIVVCNNTNTSKLVFDYVAGWEKPLPDGSYVVVPGKLALFSNEKDRRWAAQPNTVLIDSAQLESGEGMSNEFKRVAAVEIDEFKAEYRRRFPGRDAESLTDEDLLREVMNTVGKPGKLGEPIKCVVSVSMLTEGWDASTVTQLLCEQVVGRGLRRMSYATNELDMFDPQYAEVYGVPFSFIPCSGSTEQVKPGPTPTHVRALEERIACEITFPRVIGYRYDLPGERVLARFTPDAHLSISTADLPTRTEMAAIVGETALHELYGLKAHREQEIDFALARLVLDRYFRDAEGNPRPWLFPQLLDIATRWRQECVTYKDDTFPQELLLTALAHDAADRIYGAIVLGESGPATLRPILRPYDTEGSTRYVDFDTTREVYRTDPDKCHISHVVCDTGSWEQKMAQVLEDMDEVQCYVKNHNLGFTIPYTLNGEERQYTPDFLARMKGGLNLILEVSGEPRKDKAAKVATTRNLWVPAVNNHGGFGQWAFLEISDPWDAANTIRAHMRQEAVHAYTE
jgi:type III restriction enzyme